MAVRRSLERRPIASVTARRRLAGQRHSRAVRSRRCAAGRSRAGTAAVRSRRCAAGRCRAGTAAVCSRRCAAARCRAGTPASCTGRCAVARSRWDTAVACTLRCGAFRRPGRKAASSSRSGIERFPMGIAVRSCRSAARRSRTGMLGGSSRSAAIPSPAGTAVHSGRLAARRCRAGMLGGSRRSAARRCRTGSFRGIGPSRRWGFRLPRRRLLRVMRLLWRSRKGSRARFRGAISWVPPRVGLASRPPERARVPI